MPLCTEVFLEFQRVHKLKTLQRLNTHTLSTIGRQSDLITGFWKDTALGLLLKPLSRTPVPLPARTLHPSSGPHLYSKPTSSFFSTLLRCPPSTLRPEPQYGWEEWKSFPTPPNSPNKDLQNPPLCLHPDQTAMMNFQTLPYPISTPNFQKAAKGKGSIRSRVAILEKESVGQGSRVEEAALVARQAKDEWNKQEISQLRGSG